MRRHNCIGNTSKVIKMLSFLLCLMIVMPAITWAQSEKSEGFTVAGEIKFKKTGDIFLELMTEDQFIKHHEDSDNPFDSFAKLTIKFGEKESNQKTLPFVFKNVPPGTYAIQGFQDVNGNGNHDEGLFGPKEPWGMSSLVKRPRFRSPRLEEVIFELKQDITDMIIYIE